MSLSPRIEARLSKSLTMTPQLQQAIKLLRMSNLQLAEYVAAEVEKNPLLEYDVPHAQAIPARRRRDRPSAAGADVSWLDTMPAKVSLREHLVAQISATRSHPEVRRAATILAGEVDDDGYLRVSLDEVAQRHALDQSNATEALVLLQACDPAGVGARGLSECLSLQLRERNRLDPAMEVMIDGLSMIAEGRSRELQILCGVDSQDFADMLSELRALDPKPGQRFGGAPVEFAVPDIYVQRLPTGEWGVELNSETLPRVLVDNQYLSRIGATDAKARLFVSEHSSHANWLMRSLAQRARTILRVSTEIIALQQSFFAAGASQLRPLTQRMVADRLRLHESTVSRVAAGKYLACAQGIYPLRYFFSASIPALSGGESFSAIAVQDRIRQLILVEEGARTLSDDALVFTLHADGIDIARRTVAKYRDQMGIPSSVVRRRAKTGGSGRATAARDAARVGRD